jgi:hypothetical protein
LQQHVAFDRRFRPEVFVGRAIDQLRGNPHVMPTNRTAPSTTLNVTRRRSPAMTLAPLHDRGTRVTFRSKLGIG